MLLTQRFDKTPMQRHDQGDFSWCFLSFAKLTYQDFSSVSSCKLSGCKTDQGGLEGWLPCPVLCVNSIGNIFSLYLPWICTLMIWGNSPLLSLFTWALPRAWDLVSPPDPVCLHRLLTGREHPSLWEYIKETRQIPIDPACVTQCRVFGKGQPFSMKIVRHMKPMQAGVYSSLLLSRNGSLEAVWPIVSSGSHFPFMLAGFPCAKGLAHCGVRCVGPYVMGVR